MISESNFKLHHPRLLYMRTKSFLRSTESEPYNLLKHMMLNNCKVWEKQYEQFNLNGSF